MINGTKVVTIIGSTRFTNQMLMLTWLYAKQGILALGWLVRPIEEGEPNHHLAEKEGVAELFDEIHKCKIDMSDEILVLNINGYIGDRTRSELNYAIEHGKPVSYYVPPNIKH